MSCCAILGRPDMHADLETLVAACETAFVDDMGEFKDAEDISHPPIGITFGMIRRARAALDAGANGSGRKVGKANRWNVLRSQIRHRGLFWWLLRRLTNGR